MSGRLSKFQRAIDAVSSHIQLWQLVLGSGAMIGVISAWIAARMPWLASYGAIAWWFAALLGILIGVIVCLVIVSIRLVWIRAGAIRKWREQVDTINPMEPEFHHRIVRIADLVHPITQRVQNKKFHGCDLVGPTVLVATNSSFHGVVFVNCDVVIMRENVAIQNIVLFDHVQMFDGHIFNCTVFIPKSMAESFAQMGGNIVTLSGIESIDSRFKASEDRK